MFKFFHQLMNPHCDHCRLEREESRHCNSCEVLKIQLDRLTDERDRLLNKLLKSDDEPQVIKVNSDEVVKPRLASVPWPVKRAALEAESKETARILRERGTSIKEGIEKLEQEVLSN
jgi:hypothetical protein